MKTSLFKTGMKFMIILSTIAPTMSQAQSQTPQQIIKRAENYSVALKSSTEELQKLRTDLLKSGKSLEAYSLFLKAITIIEMGYIGWSLGVAAATAPAAADGATKGLVVGVGLVTVPTFTITGLALAQQLVSLVTVHSSKTEKYMMSKLFPASAMEEINQAVSQFTQQDRNLRSLEKMEISELDSVSRKELSQYKRSLLELLANVSPQHRLIMQSLDKRAQEALQQNDPANYSYAFRILTLGGDQIFYGQAVATTILARETINLQFYSLNEAILAELKTLKDIH